MPPFQAAKCPSISIFHRQLDPEVLGSPLLSLTHPRAVYFRARPAPPISPPPQPSSAASVAPPPPRVRRLESFSAARVHPINPNDLHAVETFLTLHQKYKPKQSHGDPQWVKMETAWNARVIAEESVGAGTSGSVCGLLKKTSAALLSAFNEHIRDNNHHAGGFSGASAGTAAGLASMRVGLVTGTGTQVVAREPSPRSEPRRRQAEAPPEGKKSSPRTRDPHTAVLCLN